MIGFHRRLHRHHISHARVEHVPLKHFNAFPASVKNQSPSRAHGVFPLSIHVGIPIAYSMSCCISSAAVSVWNGLLPVTPNRRARTNHTGAPSRLAVGRRRCSLRRGCVAFIGLPTRPYLRTRLSNQPARFSTPARYSGRFPAFAIFCTRA